MTEKTRTEKAAKRFKELSAVGLPAAEGEEYVEPKGSMSDKEIATGKAETATEEKAEKAKPKYDEPSRAEIVAMPLISPGMMAKLMPMMEKRNKLQAAENALKAGPGKESAYKKVFAIHKKIENFLKGIAQSGPKGPQGYVERIGHVNGEAMAADKALRAKAVEQARMDKIPKFVPSKNTSPGRLKKEAKMAADRKRAAEQMASEKK